MTTIIREDEVIDVREPQRATIDQATRRFRLETIVAWLAIVVGAAAVLGGIFGATYTYNQAAVQGITTPADAAIAEAPVRGPFTMWAQQDIITHHQLENTDGLYYAQMDRTVPAVDENGAPMFDENGEAVMVANAARNSWVTATTLTTVLGLGILAYAFSAFAFLMGLTVLGLGLIVRTRAGGLTATT